MMNTILKTEYDKNLSYKKRRYTGMQNMYRFKPHYIPGWISLIQVWFQLYFPDFWKALLQNIFNY
ncbi:hypothetical protein [Flavivirga eckloniae]|nr:hypothetical protein [Flavivirga eckloniae]